MDNGVLLEEWDDAARMYRRFGTDPVERPYTSEEEAAIPLPPATDVAQSDLDDLTVALLATL